MHERDHVPGLEIHQRGDIAAERTGHVHARLVALHLHKHIAVDDCRLHFLFDDDVGANKRDGEEEGGETKQGFHECRQPSRDEAGGKGKIRTIFAGIRSACIFMVRIRASEGVATKGSAFHSSHLGPVNCPAHGTVETITIVTKGCAGGCPDT